MKSSMKRTALVVASLMTINSAAFAFTIAPTAEDRLAQVSKDDALIKIISEASDIKVSELMATRDRIFNIIDTLNAIKADNESDLFLKYANSIQTTLALATTATLAAHINSAEKRRFMLSISAASALVTSATRFYKSRASLSPNDVNKTLNDFTKELWANKKALTPEMRELVKEVSDMSTQVLNSQSAIEKLVGNAADASYISTIMVVGLAIAHWISPKVAKEVETSLKTISARVGEVVRDAGKFADKSTLTVGASGVASVLPDLIGNAMGLSTESSKKLISETVNSLTKATINFQTEIDKIKNANN